MCKRGEKKQRLAFDTGGFCASLQKHRKFSFESYKDSVLFVRFDGKTESVSNRQKGRERMKYQAKRVTENRKGK